MKGIILTATTMALSATTSMAGANINDNIQLNCKFTGEFDWTLYDFRTMDMKVVGDNDNVSTRIIYNKDNSIEYLDFDGYGMNDVGEARYYSSVPGGWFFPKNYNGDQPMTLQLSPDNTQLTLTEDATGYQLVFDCGSKYPGPSTYTVGLDYYFPNRHTE